MTLPFAQANYGVFDTKSLGICLRFDSNSPDAFETLLALLKGKSFPNPESLHDLALVSVIDHEFRHLHDFVLSPHGNEVFRLRLAAMINGMQGVTDLGLLPVPTPLLRWSRMTAAERRAQERLWRRRVLPPERLDRVMLEIAGRSYAQVLECLASEYEIQPVDLYEASAVLAQVYAIERMAGDAGASRFLGEILGGGVPPRYARVLRFLRVVWGRLGRDVDLREFAAVVSWSLLAPVGMRPEDDAPPRRFLRLLLLFESEGVSDFDRGLKGLYAEWDAALGYTPVEDALRHNAAANEALVAMIDSVPPDHGDKLFRVVAESCRLGAAALASAHRAMAALYVEDPESYVYPDVHVDNERKIRAPVRFDFIGMGARSEDLRRRGFEIDVEIRDAKSGEDYALSATLHPEGPDAIDGQVSSRVALHIMTCDYLLFDLNRSDPDIRLARQELRKIGIETLDLLH